MRPFGVIELQCVRDAVDDAFGYAGSVAALEAGVVLGGDAGEDGDLLAAQARDPATVCVIHGQPGLLGADPGPSGGKERPDLVADVATELDLVARACHVLHDTSARASLGVPAGIPLRRLCHRSAPDGSVEAAAPNGGFPTQTGKDVHPDDRAEGLVYHRRRTGHG